MLVDLLDRIQLYEQIDSVYTDDVYDTKKQEMSLGNCGLTGTRSLLISASQLGRNQNSLLNY